MKKKETNGTWQFVSIMGHCSQWLLEQSLFLCSCPDGSLSPRNSWPMSWILPSLPACSGSMGTALKRISSFILSQVLTFFLFLEIYNMYLRGVGIPCVNVCCYVACNVCASIIPLTHESIEGSLCPL